MPAIDPITLEVVQGAFVHTVMQMRATLIRTAYAPILYESHDFSCGLLTAKGELNQSLIGMSEGDFSGHVFSFHLALDNVLEKFKDRIYPGDVIAMNDPYTGGTHLNDVVFYTPFFSDGRLLMFIAVRVHWSDVGGATPGSFSGQDTEIYQEGVRMPPVKLIERGEVNQDLWDVVFANMRLPEEREGDALAMLDTARVAEMRVAELCEKYGTDTIEACRDTLLDRGEQIMRGRISELPSGEYYNEHYCDNSGLSPDPLPIKVKLTIEGDTMHFDFTGSSPQVVGPMNVGPAITQGACFVVAKSWLDPHSPVNGGTFRPLEFTVPDKSFLKASLPYPVAGVWEVFCQVQSAVVGLFAQVIPEEAGGENKGTSFHVYVGGYDPKREKRYIFYEYPLGGFPGTNDTDGATGCESYDGGDIPSIYPAETTEQRQPLLVEGLEARTNGEGAGYRRSGFGVTRKVRILSDTSELNVMADRAVIPPWGAAGGYPAMGNSVTVIRDGREIEPSPLPGKVKSFPLKEGDVVVMRSSAGGGVGDPLTREVELVQKDLLDEYITADWARDVYGVVFKNGEVDLTETEKQRQALESHRIYTTIIAGDTDTFDHRGCRITDLSKTDADAIEVKDGDTLEFVAAVGSPLRAWVNVVDSADGEGVPMGPIGRKILNISEGDRVWIRRLNLYIPKSFVKAS